MAKKEKAKGGNLVAGRFRTGTAAAIIYEVLSDGKAHSYASLKSSVEKGVNVDNRIGLVGRWGKENGTYHVVRDGDKFRLVKGRAPKSEKKEKAAPAAKGKSKPSAKKPAGKPSGKPRVQDVPVDDD